MQATEFINDIPSSVALRAFEGTSFSPEKRAASYRNDYATTLASAYEQFKRHAEIGGTLDKLEEVFGRFRAGYGRRYRDWLNSHSRCVSWMIVGPANFPTRRAQKWNAAADKRLGELVNFGEAVKLSMLRELRPDLRPIMAGDADAIERLAVKLADLERSQDVMKKANAAIRKHAKAGAETQIVALAELGFSRERAVLLLKPDSCKRIGFPDYALTNNNANIHRVRERLKRLEQMHAQPVRDVQGQGVRQEVDPPANRVRLFFDGKPDEAMRSRLKGCGFRWTPSLGAWQAYINHRTRELADAVVQESEHADA